VTAGTAAEPATPDVADPPGPRAVLWDLDGTLVDSEPLWARAQVELAARHGGRWSPADAVGQTGQALAATARAMRDRGGVDLPPARIVADLTDGVLARYRRRVPWAPGARELLDQCRRRGVRCGLVTMSSARLVAPVLAALPTGTFATVVHGDRVSRPKPHPEPYRLALDELRLAARQVVAVEDSEPGVASARAAGIPVLAIVHHGPGRARPDVLVVSSLREVSWDLLCRLGPRAPDGPADRPTDAPRH